MEKISFIKSLMAFDKRVLHQGTPVIGNTYNLIDLKNLLFFNDVFMSNTNEIFEKHDPRPIIREYVDCLNAVIRNVGRIIQSTTTTKREVEFTREDSFERRFAMHTLLTDKVMTGYYGDSIPMDRRPSFRSGEIYYLSILRNGYKGISYVDMKSSVYQEPMCCKFKDHVLYWKTDDCIRDFIKQDLNAIDVVAVKVTTALNDPRLVTKVEYNGDTSIMYLLTKLFDSNALIVSNPFIYTGDIKQIIEANITDEVPKETQRFKPIDVLDLLEHDDLIEYPLDSFDDYLQFLRSAAAHPETKEIYLTLYRIGNDPSIFYILRDAAKRGIQVHVNVELYATGEKINKVWGQEMDKAGIDVTIYAAGELKVHSKLTLVKFNNGKAIAQIGTGNYHTKTTTQYTDLSLMTADDEICHEVEKVFGIFTGKQEDVTFSDDLLVTRYNARNKLIELIDAEADKEEAGYICMKCNALDDSEIIRHLDKAAASGCKMDLIIRGVCTWIPPELGTTVRVKSIVWDKLEHSRVYAFGNTNPTIYLGSLDLVTNKLDKRIETLVRVNDPNILVRMCDYLNRYVTCTTGSWLMTRSGDYVKE